LTWTEEPGFATDLRGSNIGVGIPTPPPDMGARRVFGAYGQTEPVGTTWLDSIGNTLGQMINIFGQQLPGVITGQPTSGMYYLPGYVPGPQTNLTPIILIGGAVLVGYLLFKKK
jgi:hypothetical protein